MFVCLCVSTVGIPLDNLLYAFVKYEKHSHRMANTTRKTTHLERPVVREHRATDQIQLTTDTTLFTVKTKPYLVMEQQSNEYILCAA